MYGQDPQPCLLGATVIPLAPTKMDFEATWPIIHSCKPIMYTVLHLYNVDLTNRENNQDWSLVEMMSFNPFVICFSFSAALRVACLWFYSCVCPSLAVAGLYVASVHVGPGQARKHEYCVHLYLDQNYFRTGCPKSALWGDETKF